MVMPPPAFSAMPIMAKNRRSAAGFAAKPYSLTAEAAPPATSAPSMFASGFIRLTSFWNRVASEPAAMMSAGRVNTPERRV